MPMTFDESMKLLILDKAALALIAITMGGLLTHYLNRRAKSEDRAAVAVEDLVRRRREAALRAIDLEIALLERRINDFLWPLTLYMRIDDVVWKRIPGLNLDGQSMPTKAGALIESQCLLPNHYRAVELIERHFSLVAEETELINPMIDYVQHVAIFRALREANLNLNPIDVGAEFPVSLPTALERVLTGSMNNLSKLKASRSAQVATLSTFPVA